MRKIILISVTLACFTLQNGSAQQKDDPVQAELSKLKGVWVEEHNVVGEKQKGKTRAESFLFNGDKYQRKQGTLLDGEPLSGTITSGTLKIDITANPKQIDLTRKMRDKNATILAIYKFDGEKLKLCWNVSKERPTSFDEGNGNYVLILVRPPKAK